jgi:hypothetical protein
VAVQENSTKFNLPNSSVVQFQANADFNLGGSTTIKRTTSEYITTSSEGADTIQAINMGSSQSPANGTAVSIISDGTSDCIADISGWTINSTGNSIAVEVYGVVIDFGKTKTLTSPLKWIPKGKRYKDSGSGANDWNAGIQEINFGTSSTSGWQFGSGGTANGNGSPTLTTAGSFNARGTTTAIYNQNFTAPVEGYYNSTVGADMSYPDTYVQYAWSSGTVAGRYLVIGMSPTNGVFNGFTMTDGGGNLIEVVPNASGTALGTTNVPSSAVTKVSGVMLLKNFAGTNTLGTDVNVYFTADNSAWTEASSYTDVGTFSDTTKIIKLGKTTCTSGSDVRWKIVWANQTASKLAYVYGIGLNY